MPRAEMKPTNFEPRNTRRTQRKGGECLTARNAEISKKRRGMVEKPEMSK
jgi:hypothetical protein